MKCSIVIPVLNSHEIVRRQILHLGRILNDDFQVVLVDDGSDPPLASEPLDWLKIIATNDTRPWTHHKARNIGVDHADGELVLLTDIDHIISQEMIEDLDFHGGWKKFHRRHAELDEDGQLVNIGKEIRVHVNSFLIQKDTYKKLGGYDEKYFGQYGTDSEFRSRCRGHCGEPEMGACIYVIPHRRNLFHTLSRVHQGPPAEQ